MLTSATQAALDQTQDLNGAELYRLAKVHALPDFVKQAAADDIVGPEDGLEQHCYAHPRGKLYPGHTPAATYISTLFFLDKRAEWDPYAASSIATKLDAFAQFHGIRERIDQLKVAFAARDQAELEQQLDPDDYAIVVEGEGHYPLRNAAEVKTAAQWLKDYRQDLPYEMRQTMAARINEKANTYGVGLGTLDDFIEKTAGMGVCPAQSVAQFLYNRSILYKRAGHLDLAIQVANMAKTSLERKSQMHEPETLQKLAGVIDQADRVTSLRSLAPDLPWPEDVFFGINVKTASRMRDEHVAVTSGNIYALDDLARVQLAPLQAQFGDSFVDAISTGGLFADAQKMAQVVPTLPRHDAEVFDRLLASMGISPMAKEAAHQKGGFDSEELQALAANAKFA